MMLFGLPNTAANFKSYVNKISAKELNVFVIIYLKNILIYIRDAGQGYVEAI